MVLAGSFPSSFTLATWCSRIGSFAAFSSVLSRVATKSPPFPFGFTLLEKCLHALDDVLRRHREAQLGAQVVQRVLECHVLLTVHRLLAEAHDHRRLRGE